MQIRKGQFSAAYLVPCSPMSKEVILLVNSDKIGTQNYWTFYH